MANPLQRQRHPLTAQQQALAEKFLPLARGLAKPLKEAWPAARDEFESAACMALVEAAEAFDPTRNVKFGTFAHQRIWGALRDVQRRQVAYGWRHGGAEHAPLLVRLFWNSEECGHVLLASPDDPVGHDLEAIEEVERWLRKLPPQHTAVCRLIYLHGKTTREVGKIVGLSQSRVSFILGEAKAILNGSWDAEVLKLA